MDDKDLLEEESSLDESSNLINNAGNAFFNHSSDMIHRASDGIKHRLENQEELKMGKKQIGPDDNLAVKDKLNNSRKNRPVNNEENKTINKTNSDSISNDNTSSIFSKKKKKSADESSIVSGAKVKEHAKEEKKGLKLKKAVSDDAVKKQEKKAFGEAIKQVFLKHPYVVIGIVVFVLLLLIVLLLFVTTTSGFVVIKDPGALCDISKPISNGTLSSQFSWRVFNGVAEPHKGIDISAESGTEVKVVMDGTIVDMGYNDINGVYVIVEHKEYNLKKYKTFYSSLLDDEEIEEYALDVIELDIGDTVDKGDVIGYVGDTNYEGGSHLHFEILADDEQISPNRLYGYDNPYGSCHPVHAQDNTVEQINKLECEKMIKDEMGLSKFCADSLEGTYTSLVCGTENISVVEPTTAQCAAGVHAYFRSFLPELDPDAWAKFERIRGNARDYWQRNSALGTEGFKTSQEPSAGSIWTCNYSRAEDAYGVPYGHVMVVLSVEGDDVNVFECNGDGKETCWHKTYTKSSLSSRRGFTGYIQILGDC